MIALIGARAAGKTTVGRSLASRLGRPFLDLDDEIAARGGAPAAELLLRSEPNFRDLEERALREIAARAPAALVLALGGGAPMRAGSQECLRRFLVIHLDAPASVLRARLRADPAARPPLLGADAESEVERVLAARLPTYRALADWTLDTAPIGTAPIDTAPLDIEAAAAAIARRLPDFAALERARFERPPTP